MCMSLGDIILSNIDSQKNIKIRQISEFHSVINI